MVTTVPPAVSKTPTWRSFSSPSGTREAKTVTAASGSSSSHGTLSNSWIMEPNSTLSSVWVGCECGFRWMQWAAFT